MGKWGKHKQKLNFLTKKLRDSSSQKSRKGGGLYIFIHESLCYKLRKYLSINAVYRPPTGDIKVFEQFCKDMFSKS